ncbi:hypothetical protein [Lysobacter sp. CA199]|uniref:hypothetical protein n=1 Tax=Lysobacter sp. CA199 TaxID=3455608 RepID=UPI003F8D4DB8
MKITTVAIVAAALAAFSCTASAQAAKAADDSRKIIPVSVGAMTCTLYVYRPRLWQRSSDPKHDRFDAPIGIECPNEFKVDGARSSVRLTKNGTDYHQDPTIFYTFSHQESAYRAYTTTSLSCQKKPAQPVNWFSSGYITVKYQGVKYRIDNYSDPAPLFCQFP